MGRAPVRHPLQHLGLLGVRRLERRLLRCRLLDHALRAHPLAAQLLLRRRAHELDHRRRLLEARGRLEQPRLHLALLGQQILELRALLREDRIEVRRAAAHRRHAVGQLRRARLRRRRRVRLGGAPPPPPPRAASAPPPACSSCSLAPSTSPQRRRRPLVMLVGRRQLLSLALAASASTAAPSSRTSRIAFAASELIAVVVAVARSAGAAAASPLPPELLGRRRERRGLLGLGRLGRTLHA